MKRAFIIGAFCAAIFFLRAEGEEGRGTPTLFFFYSQGCEKCAHIKGKVMPGIETRFAGSIHVEYKDVGDVKNYKELFELKKTFSDDKKAVFPVLFLNGWFIDERQLKEPGLEGKTIEFIQSALKAEKNAGTASNIPLSAKEADPLEYFKTFTLTAVVFAGLADGINPCSFTIMVFFISFLSFQRYGRKSIIIAGLAFISASFITYLAIGLGVLGPLYALKGFSAVSKALNLAAGFFSIIIGILCIYDSILFLKTRRPEDSILKLPVRIKDRIHRIIGDGYRKGTQPGPQDAGHGTFGLFIRSLSIGFSVSVFESVCTGQLYLPTIIYVLKTAPYKLTAGVYLVIYNIMFILPLLAIFGLAIAGISSQGFSGFFRKHFFVVKILLALIFLLIGAGLVFADDARNGQQSDASWKYNPSPELKLRGLISAPKPERPNDEFYWNFGKVEEGTVLKHKFYIKNHTKTRFKIDQINTSCACTVSKVKKDTVDPGERVSLDVQFDTTGYPGERTRYTYVHTDSDELGIIVFEIKAEISGKVEKSQ